MKLALGLIVREAGRARGRLGYEAYAAGLLVGLAAVACL